MTLLRSLCTVAPVRFLYRVGQHLEVLMNAIALSHLERATCLAQQTVVDNAQSLNTHRREYLEPSQTQQELMLSHQMAALSERQLLTAVRSGDIRKARQLVLQAAQAHAQLRGLSVVEAA